MLFHGTGHTAETDHPASGLTEAAYKAAGSSLVGMIQGCHIECRTSYDKITNYNIDKGIRGNEKKSGNETMLPYHFKRFGNIGPNPKLN